MISRFRGSNKWQPKTNVVIAAKTGGLFWAMN